MYIYIVLTMPQMTAWNDDLALNATLAERVHVAVQCYILYCIVLSTHDLIMQEVTQA